MGRNPARTFLFSVVQEAPPSVVRRSWPPVPAANHGTVVHAGRLAIYGNCVVIDHGLGVLTVYGHMSGVAVKVGDLVTKGQEIGKSGVTGLAGGDHLHLGLLVGPAFVDPVDWTRGSWMEKTLGPVL